MIGKILEKNQVAGRVLCGLAVIFPACCPFFLNAYWLRVLTDVFLYATLAQSINIIAGYTGYPAFGNVVFFGLGAYSTGVLMVKFQASFLTSVAVGSFASVLFVLILGLPVLRLKGHYFAIATLGLNEAVKAIVDNLSGLTGGGMGLSLPLRSGEITDNARFFYLLLYTVMLASILIAYMLTRSRFGYACRAIRSDEQAAASMGINTTGYKTMAWMVSSVLTAITGSIYAYWMSYIEPSAVFDMTISVKAFVMFLLGGAATVFGPIFGAFFLQFISTFAWSHLLNYHLGTFGLIIIFVVVFLPQGFATFLRNKFQSGPV